MNETVTLAPESLEAQLQDRMLQFPLGLPGFPQDRRWVLTQTPEERPFAWLSSLDTPGLAFAVTEPRHLLREFTFELDDGDLAAIGAPEPLDTALLLILRLERVGERIRIFANLRAPLIVNLPRRLGRQVILGEHCGWSDAAVFDF